MIHLAIGRQGSGKTLFLVKRANELLKVGKKIYSNVHLNFKYYPINYTDIIECNLSDSVVLLDEIHLLLSSRRSMSKLNRKICDNFLSMARKQDTEIYASSQTLRKPDVRFREEADYIYFCTKYVYDERIAKWLEVLHTYPFPPEIPIMISILVQETYSGETKPVYFLANKYFKMFDTKQVVKIKGLPEGYSV